MGLFIFKFEGSDAERLDEQLLSLAEELRRSPHLEVERASGGAPADGEKSTGPIINEMIVQIASGAITLALPPLVTAVRNWFGSQPVLGQTLTMTCGETSIDITAGTPVDEVVTLMSKAFEGAAK